MSVNSAIQGMEPLEWKSVMTSLVGIAASPSIWNAIGQNEYRRGTLTRLLGSNYAGAYLLAAWIFFSSLFRDYLFELAILANPTWTIVGSNSFLYPYIRSIPYINDPQNLVYASYVLLVTGSTLTLSSMWRLGITGTYLGDYFGILMKERVTGFPFNVMENPMYDGATMCFVSIALYSNSIVGIVLSAWVLLVYRISCYSFENPFTTMIYEEDAKRNKIQSPTKKSMSSSSGSSPASSPNNSVDSKKPVRKARKED